MVAVWISVRAGNILAAGEPRDLGAWRAAEYFFFAPNAATVSAREHQQLFAQAVGFFHVVRHEQRRPAKTCECFLQLCLHLAAQMRVEGRERLIEQQRLRLDRQGARQCRALLFASG